MLSSPIPFPFLQISVTFMCPFKTYKTYIFPFKVSYNQQDNFFSFILSLPLTLLMPLCLSLLLSLSVISFAPSTSPSNRSSMLLLLPNDVEMTSFFWLCRPLSLSPGLYCSNISASWQFVNTNMLQTCSQVFGRGGGEREGRQQSPADGHIDNFLLFSFFWTLRKSNDGARHFALNEL